MAKTIKFNLLLDNNPVRDINMLQNNFCINDVLEVYENGLLLKWLKVRGFDEYIKKIEGINKKEDVIVQLIKIFNVQNDDKEIKESIYSLQFEKIRKKSIEEFYSKEKKIEKKIEKYHQEYETLLKNITKNKWDMTFLKVASKEISDKYFKLFELDYETFYYSFQEKSPFVILAILMNQKLRLEFIENPDLMEDLYEDFTLNSDEKIEDFNEKFYSENSDAQLTYSFEEAISRYECETDGYWKDLEIKGTKVMILSIPDGTFITTPDNPKEEYSSEEVNGKFLIFDGLLYKSNIDDESIVYMEV